MADTILSDDIRNIVHNEEVLGRLLADDGKEHGITFVKNGVEHRRIYQNGLLMADAMFKNDGKKPNKDAEKLGEQRFEYDEKGASLYEYDAQGKMATAQRYDDKGSLSVLETYNDGTLTGRSTYEDGKQTSLYGLNKETGAAFLEEYLTNSKGIESVRMTRIQDGKITGRTEEKYGETHEMEQHRKGEEFSFEKFAGGRPPMISEANATLESRAKADALKKAQKEFVKKEAYDLIEIENKDEVLNALLANDGKKHSISFVKDGVEHRRVYQNGLLTADAMFKSENGEKVTDLRYNYDNRGSSVLSYDPQGKLVSAYSYNEKNQLSVMESYEEGTLKSRSTYEDGKQTSLYGLDKETGKAFYEDYRTNSIGIQTIIMTRIQDGKITGRTEEKDGITTEMEPHRKGEEFAIEKFIGRKLLINKENAVLAHETEIPAAEKEPKAAAKEETQDLHPVRVERGLATVSKDREQTAEKAPAPDLHPVRVERGIAPASKEIEKSDEQPIEVSEKEMQVLLSLEGYGKTPNKENLETFMVNLKDLMRDYASEGLSDVQAAQKANAFMSEQISRAESTGADPRIIANLKDVEKASHAFFAGKAAERNKPAPAIEPTEFTGYEEVKDDEKALSPAVRDGAEKTAGKDKAPAAPVAEPEKDNGPETPFAINENDGAPVISDPEENTITNGETDERQNGKTADEKTEDGPVLNTISNGDENDGYQNGQPRNSEKDPAARNGKGSGRDDNGNAGVGADDDFTPNPGPLEDQESLIKQATDMRYWLEYYKLEGADMEPPRASPFADIKRIRPNDTGSKLFSLGRRPSKIPGAIMDLDTGNSVLSTPNRLVLQLDTDQEKKGNNQPTFKDCMTMVLEARERGWTSLRINGSPEFQKQMYLACIAMGMKTKDFVPTQEMLNEAEGIKAQFCPEGKPSLKQHCADLDKRFPQLEELQSGMPEPPMTKQERKNFDKRMPTFETIREAKKCGLGSAYAKPDNEAGLDTPDRDVTTEEPLRAEPLRTEATPTEETEKGKGAEKPAAEPEKGKGAEKPTAEPEKGKGAEKPTAEPEKGKDAEKPTEETEKGKGAEKPTAEPEKGNAQKALPAEIKKDGAQKALPAEIKKDDAQKALPAEIKKDGAQKALPAEIRKPESVKLPVKEAASEIWKAESAILKGMEKDAKKAMTPEEANRSKLLWEAVKLEAELSVTSGLKEAAENPTQVSVPTKETLLDRANKRVDDALKKSAEPKDVAKTLSEFKKTRMAHEPQNTKDCRALGFKTQRPGAANTDLNPKIARQRKEASR